MKKGDADELIAILFSSANTARKNLAKDRTH